MACIKGKKRIIRHQPDTGVKIAINLSGETFFSSYINFVLLTIVKVLLLLKCIIKTHVQEDTSITFMNILCLSEVAILLSK